MVKEKHDTVMIINDLGRYIKLSTFTLYKLCAEGKIPRQKVDRHCAVS